ncbi:YdcF family protein [Planctomycetota bacterium]
MENTETSSSPKGLPFWKEMVIACVFPVVFVAAFAVWGYLQNGLPMVEKIVRGFVLPCGLLWLLMAMTAVWSFLRRQHVIGVLSTILFAIHGLCGGEVFSVWLSQRLEAPYHVVNPADVERFDLIVVLGGGTRSAGPTHAAFSFAGDRVGLAVRLFHADKADRLLFTGSNLPWETNMLSPTEASKRLAMDLNVPESAIMATEGHNTYQEFQHLKAELPQAENLRIGLITSATHMGRAMRLAKSTGFSMVPIPADFERRAEPPTFLSVIPSAAGYRITERCCVEYLAWLVGR